MKNGLTKKVFVNKMLDKSMVKKASLETSVALIKVAETMRKIEEITQDKTKIFLGENLKEIYIGLEVLPNHLKTEYLFDIYSIIDNNLPDKLINFGMVGTSFPKAEPIKK